MGSLEQNTTLIYGIHIRESANDGSDFSNGATDYRVLFLGEDGFLHVKDSAGTVTDPYDTGAASGPSIVVKDSDETVNNSSTLQNDDELFYAMAASERVRFEADIWFESGATPDFKHAFTVPAGATLKWSNLSFDTSAAIVPAVVVVTSSGTSTDHAGSATPQRHVHVWGYVENGGTPGNLQYQWAQNTANASDTKVLKNSNLMIWVLT